MLTRHLLLIMDGPSADHRSRYSTGSSNRVLCSVERFISRKYDYLIVGGGTAGLVVAARLTENPNVHVAVIEAGKNRMDDVQIKMPALFTKLLSNPDYDWMHTTSPQVCLVAPVWHVLLTDGRYRKGLLVPFMPCRAGKFLVARVQPITCRM